MPLSRTGAPSLPPSLLPSACACRYRRLCGTFTRWMHLACIGKERGGEGRGGLLFGRWRRRRCCGAARCCNVTRRCTAFDSCLLPSPLFLREQEHSLEGGGPNWLTPSSNRTAPRSPPSKFRCRLPPPPRHHPPPSFPPSLRMNLPTDECSPFLALLLYCGGGMEGGREGRETTTCSPYLAYAE